MFLAASILHYAAESVQTQDATNLEPLRTQFEELREDVTSAQDKFDIRYFGELGKLESEAKAKGDLGLTLAFRGEGEGYRARLKFTGGGSPFAELAKLQKTYDDQSARIFSGSGGKLVSLVGGYKTQLADLERELTKKGDIDSALAGQVEMRRVSTLLSPKAHDVSIDPDARIREMLTSGNWIRDLNGGRMSFSFRCRSVTLSAKVDHEEGRAFAWIGG